MSLSRNTLYLVFFYCYLVVQECKADDEVQGYAPAPRCQTVDCPVYSVLHTEKEFEIRNYVDALWLYSSAVPKNSTYLPTNTVMSAYIHALNGLMDYYDGGNDEGVKMDMSGPVLVDLTEPIFTAYYYVAKKYQTGGLPKPKSADVKQVKKPIKYKNAAVRRFSTFSGGVFENTIATQTDALKKTLKGSAYQRAADLDTCSVLLYNPAHFTDGEVYELFLWFD